MVDTVDPSVRSRMMASIPGKNTKPEVVVRRTLHRMGLRFRINGVKLPGRPDLVLPKYQVAVFVNGCFWHAHRCSGFQLPDGNAEFWREKLSGNVARDAKKTSELQMLHWRVLVIWECATRMATDGHRTDWGRLAHDWVVRYDGNYLEISGKDGNVVSHSRPVARALQGLGG